MGISLIIFIAILYFNGFLICKIEGGGDCHGIPTSDLIGSYTHPFRFLNNPKNSSEFCVTTNDKLYSCSAEYIPGPKIKKVQHMECVPQSQAQDMKAQVEQGKYIFIANNNKNPICIRAPKECVCANNSTKLKFTIQQQQKYNLMGGEDDEQVIDTEKEMFYQLLTSSNNFKPQKILATNLEDFLSDESGFIKDADTKIICHGFLSSSDLSDKKGLAYLLTNAYIEQSKIQKTPLNLILVDWSELSGYKKYKGIFGKLDLLVNLKDGYALPRVVHWMVGSFTSDLIEYLIVCGGASINSFHLIGHSLGGHAMGVAGAMFSDRSIGKVARLTVLDGAGPCFEDYQSVKCFEGEPGYNPASPIDAQFVDAIHTHGGVLGMRNRLGDVDFYVNGGECQPGCPWWTICSLSGCSHSRAYQLMADSINAPVDIFKSTKCKSVKDALSQNCHLQEFANMGEHCDNTTRGVYYVKTNDKSPFVGK